MNGTDWPSPAANLSTVEENIKRIVAATGVDVPSLAAGAHLYAVFNLTFPSTSYLFWIMLEGYMNLLSVEGKSILMVNANYQCRRKLSCYTSITLGSLCEPYDYI